MRRKTTTGSATAVAAALLLSLPTSVAAATKASADWAGYQVVQAKVHSASATVVVPTITCKNDRSGVGPAVLLLNTHGVFSGAGVGAGCKNDTALYEAILLTNSGTKASRRDSYRVDPGDKLQFSIHESTTATAVRVRDLSSGRHRKLTGKGGMMRAAQVGVQTLSIDHATAGIDPFTDVRFTHALVDGRSLAGQGAVAVERKRGSTVQIAVSRLRHGRSFTATFRHL
jgi:hypothetical protein